MELKMYFEGGMLNIFRGHENFAVIDRQYTEKVLDEMKFQQSGLVKDESRIKIGQILGATHLLLVNRTLEILGENEFSYVISMDLIEMESNRKIATTTMKNRMPLEKEYVDYIRTSDIRNDLRTYGRRINEFNKAQSVAINAYTIVTGKNYKDSKTFENVLRKTVITKYAEYLTGMKSIAPVTEDVKAAHKLLVEATSLQYEAFQEMLEASETNNQRMFSEANTKMDEGRQLMENYNRQIEDLVTKNIARFNDKN
jgi:ASC-1-like (ASCH) protein